MRHATLNPLPLSGVILDTKTTGLGRDAEIIEIAIIDVETGAVILNTLVNPLSPIPDEVFQIHGIDDDMVMGLVH